MVLGRSFSLSSNLSKGDTCMKIPFHYKSFMWCAALMLMVLSFTVIFALNVEYPSSQIIIIKANEGFSDATGPIISAMTIVKGDSTHIAKAFQEHFDVETTVKSMRVGSFTSIGNNRTIYLREFVHPFQEMRIHKNGSVDIIHPHSTIKMEQLNILANTIYENR